MSGVLADCAARARAWAGSGLRALLLSGSHASGEAVWAELDGARVSLSDVDLYAVMASEDDCRAAEARFALARARGETRVPGLAAPLEVAFLTEPGLARQPARPGTLALARHARLLAGDGAVLERLPAWRADEVPGEEVTLLLENRAFELLLARPALAATGARARLAARHATLKVALDVAGVAALVAGEWPDGAAARVTWARAHGVIDGPAWPLHGDARAALGRAWDEALAWRAGRVSEAASEPALAEWRAVTDAWAAAWLARAVGTTADPWARALALGRRARLRRRVRDAMTFRSRTGEGPAALARWRGVLTGTVQHRVDASAGVLLMAALRTRGQLAGAPARALAALGVVEAPARAGWDDAARAVACAWDRWLLDGQRTAEAA